jgi:hypothetical protein
LVQWFNFTLDKQVLEVCNKSLELVLEEYGTETKGILLPELEELRIGHLATVGSEYAADFQGYDDSLLKELCYETRATLSFFKCFTASDFLAAQKIRFVSELSVFLTTPWLPLDVVLLTQCSCHVCFCFGGN